MTDEEMRALPPNSKVRAKVNGAFVDGILTKVRVTSWRTSHDQMPSLLHEIQDAFGIKHFVKAQDIERADPKASHTIHADLSEQVMKRLDELGGRLDAEISLRRAMESGHKLYWGPFANAPTAGADEVEANEDDESENLETPGQRSIFLGARVGVRDTFEVVVTDIDEAYGFAVTRDDRNTLRSFDLEHLRPITEDDGSMGLVYGAPPQTATAQAADPAALDREHLLTHLLLEATEVGIAATRCLNGGYHQANGDRKWMKNSDVLADSSGRLLSVFIKLIEWHGMSESYYRDGATIKRNELTNAAGRS